MCITSCMTSMTRKMCCIVVDKHTNYAYKKILLQPCACETLFEQRQTCDGFTVDPQRVGYGV